MITKERLEELIEQGATIYSLDTKYYGCVKYLELENKLEKLEFNQIEEVKLFITDNGWWHWFSLKDLYESKEDVDEILEFGNITRMERLELPSWDIIKSLIEQKKRFGLNHSDRVLARILTKDSIYYFKLCKDLDLFTFELKQTYIGEDLCEQLSSKFPISLGKATKSNYDKARRICVKLFKGEEV